MPAARAATPDPPARRGRPGSSPVLLVLLLGLLAVSLAGEARAASWSRTYGGSGQDVAHAVAPTLDGGFVVAGETSSFSVGNADGWVLKLDALGNIQWEKSFGGAGNDAFYSVIPTADGGYAVTGEENQALLWIVKLDGSGNVQWQKDYGGSCLEVGRDIKELSGGGYVVAGNSCSFRQLGNGDGWVLNVDPNGTLRWAHAFDFMAGTETFFSILEKAGGGFAVLGETDGHTSGTSQVEYDLWFLSLDAQGNATGLDWHAGGPFISSSNSGDSGRVIRRTLDGGFVMTGETNQGAGTHDFWIVKTDAVGMIQWERYYGATGLQFLPRGLQQTLDRGYIVGGFNAVGGQGLLLKLDAQGNFQWHRRYTPGSFNRFNDATQAFDGGYVAVGGTDPAGNQDLWVVKTDPAGNIDPGCLQVSQPSATLGGPPPFPPRVTTPTQAMASTSTLAGTVTSYTASTSSSGVAQQCPAEVRVNQDLSSDAQHEVSLAADPANSSNQVAAYVDDPDPLTSGGIQKPSVGISASLNGGATWVDTQVRFGCDGLDDDLDGLADEETQCDGLDDDFDGRIDEDTCCVLEHFHPGAAADLAGNFYTGYLAQETGAPSFAGTSIVGAARSIDGGFTWSALPPATIVPYGPDLLPPLGLPDPADNLDNPSFTVERNPAAPAASTLMAAWQRESSVSATDTDVYASSLASGAASWSTPVRVNDQLSLCAESPVARWAPGQLWVAWRHGGPLCGTMPQIYVDSSFDNGITFNATGPDRPGPSYNPVTALRNHTFQPVDRFAFAVDPLNPVVLYLAWAENPGFGLDEADILFTKSLDGGITWEPPVRVNDDLTVTPQYAPALSVRTNANAWTLVDVAWYDERHSIGCDGLDDDGDGQVDEERQNGLDDDGDSLVDEDLCDIRLDVYMARTASTAGPVTVFGSNIRVTDASFTSPASPWPATLGEYLGTDADRYLAYVAWADTRNGDNDVYTDAVTDVDSDGDILTDGLDCAPADPGVALKPLVTLNLAVAQLPNGNASVTWTSQDPVAGASTVYDIVSGLLSQFNADGDYRRSACLVNDHPDTPYVDTRPAPPANDAYYYLLRATNPCGSGTFGQNPLNPADPRNGLEDGAATLPSPDPCPI